MKKTVLLPVLLLSILNGHPQGDVIFDNFGGGIVENPRTGGPVTPSEGVVAQLYASPTGAPGTFVPVPNSIVPVGVLADGYFDGGVVRIPSSIIDSGAGAFMEVHAWETAYGATFESAICAAPMGGRPVGAGISPVFSLTATGNPNASPPGTPIPLSDLVPSFSLTGVPCPEPSTYALGLLGLGALAVLYRRRNVRP